MDTKDLLKKVRKIEIKTRRLSDHIFSGEYHTSFKGRGMTFSEVRQYQYGDDIRAIDWNVTACSYIPVYGTNIITVLVLTYFAKSHPTPFKRCVVFARKDMIAQSSGFDFYFSDFFE
jgi:hypothetical protein